MEHALRVVALLALGALLVTALGDGSGRGFPTLSAGDSLALASVPLDRDGAGVGIRVSGTPTRTVREIGRALKRGGMMVTWSMEGDPGALLLDLEPVTDPGGGAMVRVAGRAGEVVELADQLGVLDSARLEGGAVSLRVPATAGPVRASSGLAAHATIEPPSEQRTVLVIGMAGWESKFVVRALEERGWQVDARLAIAPRLATVQGRPFPMDPARHAAVIALDSSSAGMGAEIARYVARGGGLVIGPGAAGPLARVAPGSLGAPVRVSRVSAGTTGKPPGGYRPVRSLKVGAAALHQRDGSTTVAAWRVGAGRVALSGYLDTWRWRMEAGESGASEHRSWWAALVATVAFRPANDLAESDPAPLTALHLAWGPQASLPSEEGGTPWWPLFLVIAVLGMGGEWVIRRTG